MSSFSLSSYDFGRIRRELAAAARRAFATIRARHPDEAFYIYALCSDEGAQSACASANTEEGFARRMQRFASEFPDFDLAARWHCPEWAYHADEVGEFRALDPLLEVDIAVQDDPPQFDPFRARLYAALALALGDLDAEGFFGAGAARESVVLFGYLAACEDAEWFALESARFLNPPATFERFRAGWLGFVGSNEAKLLRDAEVASPLFGPIRTLLGRSAGG